MKTASKKWESPWYKCNTQDTAVERYLGHWGEKIYNYLYNFLRLPLTHMSDKMISWLSAEYIAPARLSSTTYITCDFTFHKDFLHC